MIESIWHDLRIAVRGFVRDRGVAVLALASLAIGIAANTTVFSLVQAIEFPPLTYPAASRLVFFEGRNTAHGLNGMPVSGPDAEDIARSARSFSAVTIAADQSSVLALADSRQRLGGRRVTANFFDVMGVGAQLGRALASTDRPGVIVISDAIWRESFAADTTVINRTVHLDGGAVTIVGVMPPKFDADAEFWGPIETAPNSFPRADREFSAFARLAPSASVSDARQELRVISAALASANGASNRDWMTTVNPISEMHGRDSRQSFFLLQAAVAFVLLIACANIANVQLARGTQRRHEMALRLALGASRGALARQLLVESLLLSTAGGVMGIVLSVWGIRAAKAIGDFPDVVLDPSLNIFVVAFAVLLSMATGVLCGVVPAMRASSASPEHALRADGGRGATGSARGRLRATLVSIQVAAAVVLAACAVLMMQTLANRQRVALGFDPRDSVRADVQLREDTSVQVTTVNALLEDLNRTAGAAAGAYTYALPTAPGGQRDLTLPGENDRALGSLVNRGTLAVTPRYFDAMGAPLKAGRFFRASDSIGGASVAIINEKLADALWHGRSPLGEPLRLGLPSDNAPIVTVIGVVSSIRNSVMHDSVQARVYVPFAQYPNARVILVVRGSGGTDGLTRRLTSAVHHADPALMAENVRSMENFLGQFLAPIRLMTILFASFGLVGVLLAAIGVFGTMSYTVAQREREIAVRSALGANRRDIVRLVLGSAALISVAGVIPGIAAAIGATRLLGSFLFGVSASDPRTYVAVAATLVLVSLIACWRPVRMATTVDPMTVLRRN